MLEIKLLFTLLPIIAFVNAQNVERNWRAQSPYSRFGSRIIPRPVYARPIQTTSPPRAETITERNREISSTHRPLPSTYTPPRRVPLFNRPRPTSMWSRPIFASSTTAKPTVTVVVLPGDHSHTLTNTPKPYVTYVYPESYKPVIHSTQKPAYVPIAHESEPIYSTKPSSEPLREPEQQPEPETFSPKPALPLQSEIIAQSPPEREIQAASQKPQSQPEFTARPELPPVQREPIIIQPASQAPPELQTEAVSELKPQPEVEYASKPQPELQAAPELQPLEPLAQPTPEPISEQQPEYLPVSEPQPEDKPVSESQPEVQPALEPQLESQAAPEPQSEAQPNQEPQSEAQPVSEPQLGMQPTSEPQPEAQPAYQPAQEKQPLSEPQTEAQPAYQPAPENQPLSEPQTEAQPTYERAPLSEPQAEIRPSPVPELLSQSTLEPQSGDRTVQPEIEEASKPQPEDQLPHEVQHETSPAPEPQPEASWEPEHVSEPQPKVHTAPIKLNYITGIGSSRNPISSTWTKPSWSHFSKPSKIPNHPYPWVPTSAKPIPLPSRITSTLKPLPILSSPTPKPVYVPVPTARSPIYSSELTGLADYQCEEPNGYYAVQNQCDSFVECKANTARQVNCPDGLHFNPKAVWPEYPCAYPSQVRCAAHFAKQIPKPTADCPRQYGYFPASSGDCGEYVLCQEGRATKMSCPPGLAFNIETTACDWPANVPSCNPDVFKGFTCPAPESDKYGKPSDLIYKYRYGKSCKKYIACQHGRPRLLSCDDGLSFDVPTQSCIDEDFVTDCS